MGWSKTRGSSALVLSCRNNYQYVGDTSSTLLTRWGPSWSNLVTPSNLIVVSISSLMTDLIIRASLRRENRLLTFYGMHHSLLSVGQRIEERSTHTDAFRSQAKSFNDVCTSSATSIDIHLHMDVDQLLMGKSAN